MNLKEVKVTTIKLTDTNGMIIELLKFSSHSDNKEWGGKVYSTGLTHIALNVESISYILSACSKRGFSNQQELKKNKDESLFVMYFRGPDNVILELVEKI